MICFMPKYPNDEHYYGSNQKYTIWIIREPISGTHHIFYIDLTRLGIFKYRQFKGDTDKLLNHYHDFDLQRWTSDEISTKIDRVFSITRYVKSDISKKVLGYIKKYYQPTPVNLENLFTCDYCRSNLSKSRAKQIVKQVRQFYKAKYFGLKFSTIYLCKECEDLLDRRDLSEYELKQKWKNEWNEINNLYLEGFTAPRNIWDQFDNASLDDKQSIFWKQAKAGFLVDDYEMLNSILKEYKKLNKYDQFISLLEKFRSEYPEVYQINFAYYVNWLIKILYREGQINKIKPYFQYFANDVSSIDEYFDCLNLLAFLGTDDLSIEGIIFKSIQPGNEGWFIGDVPGELADWYIDFVIAKEYQKYGINDKIIDTVIDKNKNLSQTYEFLNSSYEQFSEHLQLLFGSEDDPLDFSIFKENSKLDVNESNMNHVHDLLDKNSRFLMEQYNISYLKCSLLKKYLHAIFAGFFTQGKKKDDISLLYPWKNRYKNTLRRSKFFPIKGQKYMEILYVELLPLTIEFLTNQELIKPEHKEILLKDNQNLIEEISRFLNNDKILGDKLITQVKEYW